MRLEKLKRSSDFSWGKYLKFKQEASRKDYTPNLHLTFHKVFGARILAVFIDITLQNIVRMQRAFPQIHAVGLGYEWAAKRAFLIIVLCVYS